MIKNDERESENVVWGDLVPRLHSFASRKLSYIAILYGQKENFVLCSRYSHVYDLDDSLNIISHPPTKFNFRPARMLSSCKSKTRSNHHAKYTTHSLHIRCQREVQRLAISSIALSLPYMNRTFFLCIIVAARWALEHHLVFINSVIASPHAYLINKWWIYLPH